ncbi:UDP-glucose--hexose-1-phosphate uridylyltransferase [Salinicoccus sp. ID82-1]|uniref:UDP-glucose--hexose-1-phosphate uridylyltransferase n=1 Tax=Salinicoccus sp. ID82-1 TaxID=2820269 RepID=UPI001F2ED665|nr:UDP-glucose--hexose-1-phosphate uridylyltransferase [Salinicoccus sp. ID82-1]MCG1008465.1 UDP-glucose--hexose-1-phosphate uridylyltransferase [Salinicoccus sp. ID82-1]
MKTLIDHIVDDAIALALVEERDRIYIHNQMMAYIPEEMFFKEADDIGKADSNTLIEYIAEQLAHSGVIEDQVYAKDLAAANMMNILMPKPSDIEERFYANRVSGIRKATDDFYNISVFSNYIQKNRISQNISFSSESKYGELELTINLSKPEKSTEEIRAAQSAATDSDYPQCLLCKENEGYIGHINHPPRANHRIIRLELGGGEWYFQFSPYSYYSEHSIVLSKDHVPMQISTQTFHNLIDFVDQFPHYFIGSNADLPIVGGSMLAHEHYQAGRHVFPVERAESFHVTVKGDVKLELLKWPLSTIRVTGEDREAVIRQATVIMDAWNTYDNPELDILSHTDAQHSTVTPIARKTEAGYVLYLILRNNRTTEERPNGIFHVDPEDFHVKRENIGLIEAMGLAVLPARLKQDAEHLQGFFTTGEMGESAHAGWIESWRSKYGDDHIGEHFEAVFHKELGLKFESILEACSVFKNEADFVQFFEGIDHDQEGIS